MPSSNASISFTANISDSDLSVIDKQSVNSAIVKEIRSQAPISSLSAGATVSQTQVVSYSFQRTEAVQPNVDSVNIVINGSIVSVDLNDIDGSNTAASSAADVTAAIVRSINNAGIEVTATASGTPPNYGVTLSANNPGVPFTVEAFEFNDVNQIVSQTQFSLTSETPSLSLPDEGTSVAVKYGDQIYTLTMQEGEVMVTGPESGRLTAYFDVNSRLQIFGGGSLSGSAITVLSDTELSGNSDAAEKFGLLNSTTRLTGQLFTLTSSMEDLDFNFGGQVVTVSLDLSGNVTTTPTSITGLTLHGSLKLQRRVDSWLSTMVNCIRLTFDNPTNALGFKTADREISVSGDEILVSSTDKQAFKVSASGESLAETRFQLNNLPHEDLLIFVTGGGARSIGAEYSQTSVEEDLTTYEIRAVGENGNVIEIYDADTNHSIATRVVSGDQQTTYRNFEFTLRGRVENGDSFILSQDASGQNDGRNIDAIINLRSGDPRDPTKLSFQDMFGVMIAGVGSSVNSSKIATDIQEENMMAAKEAEAEFAGVNLDTEAAALIEFQQAYQASARILSTARELFQSLMEVV